MYPSTLESMAMGGNPLGMTDSIDASSGSVVFQFLCSCSSISGSGGEGPHSTHTVTPWIRSQETRRNGTWGKVELLFRIFKKYNRV